MYRDDYFPDELVDKVKGLIVEVVTFIENNNPTTEQVQAAFDEMTLGINDLQEEFEENDSELETVARESIGETVQQILDFFSINIDIEEAIREREW